LSEINKKSRIPTNMTRNNPNQFFAECLSLRAVPTFKFLRKIIQIYGVVSRDWFSPLLPQRGILFLQTLLPSHFYPCPFGAWGNGACQTEHASGKIPAVTFVYVTTHYHK